MSNHALSTAGRFPVRRKRPNRPAVDNASRFVASAERGPVQTERAACAALPFRAKRFGGPELLNRRSASAG